MVTLTRAQKRRNWRAIGGFHRTRRMRFCVTGPLPYPKDFVDRRGRRRIILMGLQMLRLRMGRLVHNGVEPEHRERRVTQERASPRPGTWRRLLGGHTFTFITRMEAVTGRKRATTQ